jgi:hypothetical protein
MGYGEKNYFSCFLCSLMMLVDCCGCSRNSKSSPVLSRGFGYSLRTPVVMDMHCSKHSQTSEWIFHQRVRPSMEKENIHSLNLFLRIFGLVWLRSIRVGLLRGNGFLCSNVRLPANPSST